MTSYRHLSCIELPILPDGWLKRGDVIRLYGYEWLQPQSNTHDQVWGIAFLVADDHHIAYRYLIRDQFAYGG